jgi:hypothetical protein
MDGKHERHAQRRKRGDASDVRPRQRTHPAIATIEAWHQRPHADDDNDASLKAPAAFSPRCCRCCAVAVDVGAVVSCGASGGARAASCCTPSTSGRTSDSWVRQQRCKHAMAMAADTSTALAATNTASSCGSRQDAASSAGAACSPNATAYTFVCSQAAAGRNASHAAKPWAARIALVCGEHAVGTREKPVCDDPCVVARGWVRVTQVRTLHDGRTRRQKHRIQRTRVTPGIDKEAGQASTLPRGPRAMLASDRFDHV